MKQNNENQHITAKAALVVTQFLLGAVAVPWWIITYYMISGTLQEEHTAPVCVPIGIGMVAISLLITFFLIKGAKKVFNTKIMTFLFTALPFFVGVGIFLLCAFLGVQG